ncbi:MAG: hypothetical protein ACRCYT_05000 [Cetobacterium sp.]
MKKIIFLYILITVHIFGKVSSSSNRIFERRELIGGITQNQIFVSSTIKLTGLGNIDKITYDFERFGRDYFINNSGESVQSIKIKTLEITSSDSYVNKEKQEITNFNGNLQFKVIGIVEIKSDDRLSGIYRSPNITLILNSEKGNNKDEEVRISLEYELHILKPLKIKTTQMDLGVGVQGQEMSTFEGTPGYLEIEGEVNRGINISYPNEVEIYNLNKNGQLKVFISTPELQKLNEEEYSATINSNDKIKIKFLGKITDTKNSPPGKYEGSFVIRVRYD